MNLKELLDELSEQKGSDLHLVVGQPPVFRIDGSLIRRTDGPILDRAETESLILPHLTDAQKLALSQGEDVEKYLRLANHRYRFHIFHDRGNLAASLRRIPTVGFSLEELNLPPVVEKLTHLKRGLIVVAGSTGGGKTTTVAGMVEAINRDRAERIITIEDPIEYEFESKKSIISQRSVGEDVPTFPYGLRSVLREDPDVIMIGEVRDLETMVLSFTLADTGHLVFSTLNVNSASDAVRRLIEVFPESQQPAIRRLVANNLQAVIVQMLMPRHNKPGRVPAAEVLIATQHVRRMINEGQFDLTVGIEAGRDIGMQTMDDSLIRLYEQGTISYDMAWFRMSDKNLLKRKEEE